MRARRATRRARLRPARRLACALGVWLWVAQGCEPAPRAADPEVQRTLSAASVPDSLQGGAALFAARCAACHGPLALGTDRGPPLVHAYYRPAHHADAAFLLAVRQGVRAHHWSFGDMPPVPGLAREEVEAVVSYIRWLQRTAGIY